MRDDGKSEVEQLTWENCPDPELLLDGIRVPLDVRKLRLYSAACCRRIDFLLSQSGIAAIEEAERFADGLCSPQDVRAKLLEMELGGSTPSHVYAAQAVHAALYMPELDDLYLVGSGISLPFPFTPYAPSAFALPQDFAVITSIRAVSALVESLPDRDASREQYIRNEYLAQATMLRDLLGGDMKAVWSSPL